MKLVSKNKSAWHDYEILEQYEAGLALQGSEIKAVRAGKVRLEGSYARFLLGNSRDAEAELFVVNLHLGIESGDPTRTRKLLMHRREIDHLRGLSEAKGLTLVPLSLYFKKGFAKLEVGVGRGLKLHDKRDRLRRKAIDRDIAQDLRGK